MSAHVRFLISCYLDAIVEPMVSGDYLSAIIHAIQATAVAAHRLAVLYLVLRSAKETGQRRGCAVLAKTVEWVEPLLATGHLRYA